MVFRAWIAAGVLMAWMVQAGMTVCAVEPSAADSQPSDSPVRFVPLAGVHPGVISGLGLYCEGNLIRVAPGRARIGDETVNAAGGQLRVDPAEIAAVDGWPITLTGDPVQTWHGGNRLVIHAGDPRNVLNTSYVPGSLELTTDGEADFKPAAPQDFVVDDTWGAFSLPATSRLKAGQRVHARYRVGMRRVDSLVLDVEGRLQLLRGKPAPDCPTVPEPPPHSIVLANIYRPFMATQIERHHIYVPVQTKAEGAPLQSAEALQPILAKLQAGKDVTIVCWGDSVTDGGDVRPPEHKYVRRFESLLREGFPGARLRVINAGIGGTSTTGRLPAFQKEVLDHHPDLVTLEFVNDMGASGERLQANYAEILKRVRSVGASLLIITPHFTMPAWMPLEGGRGKDPRPAVAFLRKFARDNHIPLADASRRWEQLELLGIPYEILLANGINHPDARGHLLFAEELMRYFPANPSSRPAGE